MWNYLKNTSKPILLYGMGDGADKILKYAAKFNIKIDGVFASDGFARHNIFQGFEVISFSEAKEKFGDFIALLSFGTHIPSVVEYIKKIALECELLAPDVPLFGDILFDKNYVLENKSRIEKIYSLLADDISKKTYERVIKYKISGDINYLFDCEINEYETYENIIRFGDDEIFCDIGAYRGDTVEKFIANTNGKYQHIYAFEPDEKTFKKLQENTKNIDNISLFNILVGEREGIAHFSMAGGRNSAASDNGKEIISNSIDNILSGNAATFIKIDAEGMEKEIISGMKNTVLSHKPKMLISAYHKSEDIFEIAEKILEIRDDYKIYYRHYPCLPAWDTSFIFV